jgi:rhodanese-related sulfurtransferase
MHFLQENWMLVLVFVSSGLMLAWSYLQGAKAGGKNIGCAEATMLVNRQDAVLLDVREANEFEGGRLPNAIHIPLSQLKDRTGELAKHKAKPVVVYCATGRRSRMAAGPLAKAGFASVYNLAGGIDAWRKDGLPLEK